LQSIMPAPVFSRSDLTAAAVTSAIITYSSPKNLFLVIKMRSLAGIPLIEAALAE